MRDHKPFVPPHAAHIALPDTSAPHTSKTCAVRMPTVTKLNESHKCAAGHGERSVGRQHIWRGYPRVRNITNVMRMYLTAAQCSAISAQTTAGACARMRSSPSDARERVSPDERRCGEEHKHKKRAEEKGRSGRSNSAGGCGRPSYK